MERNEVETVKADGRTSPLIEDLKKLNIPHGSKSGNLFAPVQNGFHSDDELEEQILLSKVF